MAVQMPALPNEGWQEDGAILQDVLPKGHLLGFLPQHTSIRCRHSTLEEECEQETGSTD